MVRNKVYGLLLACCLAAWPLTSWGTIVNNVGTSGEDSVVVAVINWDSAGMAPVSADSFWVMVIKADANDATFKDSGTTSMAGVDSTMLASKTIYYFHRAVADIDGDGGTGQYYGEFLAKNTSLGLYAATGFTFQVVGWELDEMGDSASSAARLYDSLLVKSRIVDSLFAVLDSLHSQYGWVSSFDPASTPVTLSSTEFVEMADTLFGRDSSIFGEGYWHKVANRADSGAAGGSIDSAAIARSVWNTPQGNHTVAGSFGKYLDSEVSGIGAGSGVYSCDVVAFDSSVSLTIPNATVVIRNLAQTSLLAVGKTDSDGRVSFNLDAGDYVAIVAASGYLFTPYDTIAVTSDQVDTVLGDQFDPGAPLSPELCRVYGHLRDIQGQPESSATLSAHLPSGIVRYNNVIVSPSMVSTTVDEDGYFYLDLIPSDKLSPSGTAYEFSLTRSNGTILRQRITVPDSTAWLLSW